MKKLDDLVEELHNVSHSHRRRSAQAVERRKRQLNEEIDAQYAACEKLLAELKQLNQEWVDALDRLDDDIKNL